MKIFEFDLESYGRALKSMRLDCQMTQVQLAKKAGVTQGTIFAYESGDQTPNMGRLIKICKVLGVDEVRIDTSGKN